jgi:hypothetical protein
MTRMCALALTALSLGASISTKADEPLSPATVADVRCVVVGSVAADDPAHASSAALLTLYFLGRIDGREPASFNLSQAMLAQIRLMSQEDLSAEGKRCGKELEGRAVYMTEVGKTLMEQSK